MPLIRPDGVIVYTKGAPAIITTPKAVSRVLPNWLHSFAEYTNEAESPLPYLRWAGLSTIAAAAQRKIWAETEYFSVHSNMYIILVGPPGSKKSTAIDQGRKLIRQVPNIHFTTSAASVAGLIQQFISINSAAHQSLNAYVRELSSILSISKEDMTDFLLDIYDGSPDWDKQLVSKAKERISAPWLNLITGTVPEWMGDNITRSMMAGGLFARTLFVYSDERVLKSPWPKKDPKKAVLAQQLVNDLVHISTLEGEFTFSDEAMEWYNAWYLDASRFPRIDDNRTAGYYVRKPIHLLKVAMAVSLAQRSDLVFSLEDLLIALAMLDTIEPGMPHAFSSVGGNIYATDLERVENQILGTEGGLPYKAILKANYHAIEKYNLDRILESLVAMGTVEEIMGLNGAGKLVKSYKRTGR